MNSLQSGSDKLVHLRKFSLNQWLVYLCFLLSQTTLIRISAQILYTTSTINRYKTSLSVRLRQDHFFLLLNVYFLRIFLLYLSFCLFNDCIVTVINTPVPRCGKNVDHTSCQNNAISYLLKGNEDQNHH